MKLPPELLVRTPAMQESVKRVVKRLNSEEIITDEDDTFVTSYLIEYCRDELGNLLRNEGYKGGDLANATAMFGKEAVYALYDTTKHTPDDVIAHMERCRGTRSRNRR